MSDLQWAGLVSKRNAKIEDKEPNLSLKRFSSSELDTHNGL
jgi:hypothetical protein